MPAASQTCRGAAWVRRVRAVSRSLSLLGGEREAARSVHPPPTRARRGGGGVGGGGPSTFRLRIVAPPPPPAPPPPLRGGRGEECRFGNLAGGITMRLSP